MYYYLKSKDYFMAHPNNMSNSELHIKLKLQEILLIMIHVYCILSPSPPPCTPSVFYWLLLHIFGEIEINYT